LNTPGTKARGFAPDLRRMDRPRRRPSETETGRMPGFDTRERSMTGPADKTRIIR
jgi:hypothetical protein